MISKISETKHVVLRTVPRLRYGTNSTTAHLIYPDKAPTANREMWLRYVPGDAKFRCGANQMVLHAYAQPWAVPVHDGIVLFNFARRALLGSRIP